MIESSGRKPKREAKDKLSETVIEIEEYNYTCSRCEEPWVIIEGTPQENGMKYCPNCGVKMKGE